MHVLYHAGFSRPVLHQIAAVLFCAASWTAGAQTNPGLVAYYPFEGNAADRVSQNHGIERGGAAYAPGLGGGLALSLDGIDDFVELPPTVEGDFSVGFWVNTTAQAPMGTDWYQGLGIVDGEVCGSPPGGDWGIALLSGGRISFADRASQAQVNDGLWHAVVVTRNSGDGRFAIFIDGQLEAEGFGGFSPLNGVPFIGVGNNPCDVQFGRRYFPGLVDELRFYNRVLTPEEIETLSTSPVFADSFESRP
ncbi:MAG: LamG domain-containing protein [Xanthomonadales bacterium]|nr:LamG domain-containing protein [Xanthomonadales bacterium]